MKPATELIHVADGIRDDAAPLTTPIYETTTFVFENAQQVRDYNEGRSTKFLYSRYANPTVLAVEAKIAGLEAPERRSCFRADRRRRRPRSSALLAAGDEVVCSGAIYGGTLHLIADLLPKFGIRPRFVSIDELRQPASILSPATKLVWFESPINPTLRCVDIAAVAAACRARGVTSVDRQHVCQPDQSAAARARRRHRDAQRDQVPQRPQRRDGGRRSRDPSR